MAEKIEQSLPWLTILAIFVLTVFGVGVVVKEIMADTVIPTVTVGSAAPTFGTIVLNGNNAISLVESSFVYVNATVTITDTNGYTDIKSVTSSLECNQTTTGCGLTYRNANWCYYIPNGAAAASSTCATTSCAGNSCTIVCGTPVWFVAEPTDASGTYPAKTWEIDITAYDNANNIIRGSATQELNILPALEVSSTIAYGSLNPGATSTEKHINSTNTGNLKIDLTMLGTGTEAVSAYIDSGRQKYATESDMGNWSTGTALASTAAALWNYDLIKPTATTTNTATGSIYWMIYIPDGQTPGTYSGTTTITPVWSATNT